MRCVQKKEKHESFAVFFGFQCGSVSRRAGLKLLNGLSYGFLIRHSMGIGLRSTGMQFIKWFNAHRMKNVSKYCIIFGALILALSHVLKIYSMDLSGDSAGFVSLFVHAAMMVFWLGVLVVYLERLK
jgi:hypothetical protein